MLGGRLGRCTTRRCGALMRLRGGVRGRFGLSGALIRASHRTNSGLVLLRNFIPARRTPTVRITLRGRNCCFRRLSVRSKSHIPVGLGGGGFGQLCRPVAGVFSLPGCARFSPAPLFTPFFVLFFKLYFKSKKCNLLILLTYSFFGQGIGPSFGPCLALFRCLNLTTVVINAYANSFFKVTLTSIPTLSGIGSCFMDDSGLVAFSVIVNLIRVVFKGAITTFGVGTRGNIGCDVTPFT